MKKGIVILGLFLVLSSLSAAESKRGSARVHGPADLTGVAMPFFDNFEDGKLNGWVITDVDVRASTERPKNGNYSMRLYDRTTSTTGTGVKLTMNTTSPRIGVEFWEWTNDFGWNGGSSYELTTTTSPYSGWSLVFGATCYTDSNWQYIDTQDKSRWANRNLWETDAVDFPAPVPARANSWHKIKIEVYGPEGKARFWFDGQYKGEIRIAPTTKPLKYFNHGISWSAPTTCINYIDDFRTYEIGGKKGVALPFFDNFEDGNLNGWTVTDVEVTASTQRPKNGNYSMKLYDRTTSTTGTGVKLMMNTTSPRIGVEFWEWTNDFGWNGGSSYELTTTTAPYSGWSLNFGATCYTDSNWQYVDTQDKSRWAYGNLWETDAVDFPLPVRARAGSWHKIKIEVYGPEGKARFWFDGQYKGEILVTPTTRPLKYFNHGISWSSPTTCINYIDDFRAYEIR